MSVKNIGILNQSTRSIIQSADEMTKALQGNTKEMKKIAKAVVEAIEEGEQEQIKDWRKVDRINESTQYPLAEGSPPAVELDGAALLMKKLNVL